MIKFNKYNVSNGEVKARIRYSLDNRIDGRKCVTLYDKDFEHKLGKIFKDLCINETDSREDYFEKDRVVLFEDHPLYAIARARAEK